MSEKELNKELKEKAIACGLCQQWQNEWQCDWSMEKMISQFYRGLDFFLKKRFVSNSFIKKNVPIEFRRSNGILVDDKYSLVNPENAILLGKSESTIRINGSKASHVYVTDKGKLTVIAKNRAFVLVHLLDDASVDAQAFDSARLVVIQHSNGVSIKTNDLAIVKREFGFLK